MLKQSNWGILPLSIIMSLFLSFGFFSCSDNDDEIKYPKALTYKSKQVVEFKLYVGSENGGVEVSTKDLDPKNYWKDGITDDDQSFPKLNITFTDDENITVNNHSTQYSFDNGVMSVYDKEDKEWNIVGYGNRISLRLASAYAKDHKIYENGYGSSTWGEERNITLSDFIGEGENYSFSSLADMKHKEDTIMWCNTHYIYE